MDQQPAFLQPMECLHTASLPEGSGWVYEVKLDGYRAQTIRSGGTVHLLSRNGKDLGRRFPGVVAALTALPKNCLVDGELVALDETGRPNFSLIQNSASSKATFVFFAFDLLRLDGRDLTGEPLSMRRRLLEEHLTPSQTLQLSEQFTVPAERMVRMVREYGLEGVVAKRLDSLYEPGLRSGAWTKLRVNLSQEFVIGGYTPGTHGFDAVVIGFHRGDGLHSAQKCGRGSFRQAGVKSLSIWRSW